MCVGCVWFVCGLFVWCLCVCVWFGVCFFLVIVCCVFVACLVFACLFVVCVGGIVVGRCRLLVVGCFVVGVGYCSLAVGWRWCCWY